MSTAATPTAPAVPLLSTGNTFDFTSQSGTTKVTFSSVASGPIVVGQPRGASLSYTGPEGALNFNVNQITQDQTPIGNLLSVVLKQDTHGSTIFSLFVPTVEIGPTKSQTFSTYAIKAHKAGSPVAVPGSELKYEVEHFNGDAKILAIAL